MGIVRLTQRLDSMVLEVSPNRNDSESWGRVSPKKPPVESPLGWMQHHRGMSLRREDHCVCQ